MKTTYTKSELTNLVKETLHDDMSRMCYSEVTDTLINELVDAIINKNSIYGILNDNLSNVAVDELDYETNTIAYFNSLSSNLILK